MLIPVLGFLRFTQYIAADRYTYLSGLFWPLLITGIILFFPSKTQQKKRTIVLSFFILIVMIFIYSFQSKKLVKTWRNSETLWMHTLSIDPVNNFAINNLGIYYKKENRWTDYVKLHETIAKILPQYPELFLKLGDGYFQLGDYANAEKYFRKEIEIDPKSSAAYNNLGFLLKTQKKHAEASKIFETAKQLAPNSSDVFYNLGSLYTELGQNKKAIQSFSQAVKINPTMVEAYNNLGTLYALEKNFTEAENALRTAIKLEPLLDEPYYNLGIMLGDMGRFLEAKTMLLKTLELNPQHFKARNKYGLLLALEGNIPDAEKEFRKAIEIQPRFTDALINLYHALVDLHKSEEAEIIKNMLQNTKHSQ
jgi:tetratricopeptide (TPR) repeat protein